MIKPVAALKTFAKYQIFALTISLLTFFYLDVSCATTGAPAWLESVEVDEIIHVNQHDPLSSDLNPGSKDLPLNTINAAATLAMRNHKRGFSTKVLIYPGIYREQIKMSFNEQKEDPLIIFEAERKGTAIISGSEIWTDWEKTELANVYMHTWPYKWSLSPYPPGWKDYLTLQPIVRRREIVFVDGNRLEQAMSFSDLTKGQYYVSEEDSLLFVFPPEGKPLSKMVIEIGTRSRLFGVDGKTNLKVKGLTFQHATSEIEGSAVTISQSSNVLFEDCTFIWNNWHGLRLHEVRNVTSRGNKANFNGGTGMTAFTIKSYLSVDDETSYNNWRGASGGFVSWAVGGTKYMRLRDALFRRHVAKGNHSGGFWLDYDNENVLVEDSTLCGNLRHGLFIEASQGPISIKNTKIYSNKQYGIRAMDSRNVFIEHNYIIYNGDAQIKLHGLNTRPVKNWETGKTMAIKMEQWSLNDNVIASNDTLLESADWEHFLRSLNSQGNLWYKQQDKDGFKIEEKQMNFLEWKTSTGQDSNSTFTESQKEVHDLAFSGCTYTPH